MGSVTNKYHAQFGPVVKIKVMPPSTEVRDKEVELTAMVDTGATRTVVKEDVAKELFKEAGPILVRTILGWKWLNSYSCRIAIVGLERVFFKIVVASEFMEYEAILGRDVIDDSLNWAFKGPKTERTLDIVDPSQHVS